jgi:tRNA(Ile)-lysidine synthetase-like protein
MIQEWVIWPRPGKYILAVSGGADSMVLLDIFARSAVHYGYELIVAHFDHGLRADSRADLGFVDAAATRYGLAFLSTSARLADTSEATSRSARHAWLEVERTRTGAEAIMTAHHADDLIETSILNLARGSGRRGLAPMLAAGTILRPLLRLDRIRLRAYAADNNLTWREDPTNAITTNPRNFLRRVLLPKAPAQWSQQYLSLITSMNDVNREIDHGLSDILGAFAADSLYSFPRDILRSASEAVIAEILLSAARSLRPGIQIDRLLIREIAHFAKAGNSGKLRPIRQGLVVSITKAVVILTTKPSH